MPIETMIRHRQGGYYQALQSSREPEIDAAMFIDYMLDVIAASLASYDGRAKAETADVGVNAGVNDAILLLLRAEPGLSAAAVGERIGKASRTVERHLADLKAAGRVRREGSAKAGCWVVMDR